MPNTLVCSVSRSTLQVFEERAVDAHADAGVGDHGVGQPLAVDARAPGCGDRRTIGYVSHVDLRVAIAVSLREHEATQLVLAPRHQRQSPPRGMESPAPAPARYRWRRR